MQVEVWTWEAQNYMYSQSAATNVMILNIMTFMKAIV